MTSLSLKQRLALVKWLTEMLAKVKADELGPEAVREWVPGERFAVKFGGDVAAWASMPNPPTYANVTHEAKLLAWVKANHPHQVETVEMVRPEFIKDLGESLKKHGGWVAKGGEVIPIPGMETKPGKSSPRVDLNDDAGDIIGRAWRDGHIDMTAVLALPAPAPGDAA